jgi:GT2 family glycosyltransferase
MNVAAVIPTWNGWDDTDLCLKSLAAADPAPVLVRVVDNGSSDGTPDRIRSAWPEVDLLALPENLGFSRAVNRAIEDLVDEPAVEAIFLLNNDVEVDPGVLAPLCETLIASPRVAGVCPLVTYADPRERIWYGGGTVSLWRGRVGHRHIRARVDRIPTEVRDTGYLTGAAALLSCECLREVGLLDERFPFYAEDVDWSLRARRAGWRLRVDPAGRVAHRVSASLGGPFSRRKLSAKMRAMRLLFRLHARPWEWVSVLPAGLLITLPQTAADLLRGRRQGRGR